MCIHSLGKELGCNLHSPRTGGQCDCRSGSPLSYAVSIFEIMLISYKDYGLMFGGGNRKTKTKLVKAETINKNEMVED